MIEVFLLALLAYALFGPVVLKGDSAVHNIFAVWMPSAGSVGNHLPSVLVQERGKWRLSKFISIIAAFVVILIGDAVGASYFIDWTALAVWFLIDNLSRKIPGYDYAGHGAEIMAAEEFGLVTYRDQEIYRMRFFDNRKDMTADQVDAELRRWHWLAKIVKRLGDGTL